MGNELSAEFLIKREILKNVLGKRFTECKTDTDVGMLWDETECDYDYECDLIDETSEFRCSGQETSLNPEQSSMHYECEQVAKKLSCGNSVCWTYWHGGGKHGEPECIDWMSKSYLVDCKEEVKTMTVRTYTKKVNSLL